MTPPLKGLLHDFLQTFACRGPFLLPKTVKFLLAETRLNNEIRWLQAGLHAANITRPFRSEYALKGQGRLLSDRDRRTSELGEGETSKVLRTRGA